MACATAEKLAQRALQVGILDDRQLQEAWGVLGSRSVHLDDLVQVLIRREMLTNYQVKRLMRGERFGFFFGDYKVLYNVGSGTFARVYRAIHKDSRQVVALKVLRKKFSDNPEHFEQFLREGQLGCSLRHPNIVPTYEVISDKKKFHFLVMEFVEGWNLREFLKIRKKIDPVVATKLALGIARGLMYAFNLGLTHRDLKLSNILVSSSGEAKIVDFGLAGLDETLGDESNARTIDYAALERVTGVRRDDSRSDLYFLGCIFYHMLTGSPALAETTDRVQRLSKARFTEVIPIQRIDRMVPHSVAKVVNKAMMLNPKYRYQTAAAMLAELEMAQKRLVKELKASKPLKMRDAAAKSKTKPIKPENQRSVMIVESNTEMQNIFRDGFKKAGYRVLLTVDPSRALQRFQQDPRTADCVIFDAQELGESALEAFNQFSGNSNTDHIKAILLLGEDQKNWRKRANLSATRFAVEMPITMKQLRTALEKIVPEKPARS